MKFNLKKVVLKKHPIFGESFEVSFTDKNDFKNEVIVNAPYTSLIIGPNGTGKSYLLKEIAEIFILLKDIKEKSELVNYHRLFEITFNINSEDFIVSNFSIEKEKIKRTKTTLYQSSKEIYPEKLILPETILVSSLLINDKFTVKNNYDGFYKYLGVRSLKTPSIAGTKSYIKRTLDLIYYNLTQNQLEISNKIQSLLGFLNYETAFRVTYKLRYKDYFFNQPLTIERFDQLFVNFNDSSKGFSTRKDSEFIPFGVRYYHTHVAKNATLKSNIVEFINYIREVLSNNLTIDIFTDKIPLNYYSLIGDLNSLDLISFPQLHLKRKEKSIDINEISSGEYHILMSFIGIYASIEHNSLVLIDEPEISLHPNWQMRYISYLKEIFKYYQSCHFLITSHSHFFASDLDGRHSKIIGLKRDIKDKIEKVDLPKDLDTYGWSVEDVLYNVFDVISTRNKFVASDVATILNELSKGDKNKINYVSKEQIEKLKHLENNLKDNDPFKAVVKSILKKIS
jgi:predicted ATP-binding protein involved in virulence